MEEQTHKLRNIGRREIMKDGLILLSSRYLAPCTMSLFTAKQAGAHSDVSPIGCVPPEDGCEVFRIENASDVTCRLSWKDCDGVPHYQVVLAPEDSIVLRVPIEGGIAVRHHGHGIGLVSIHECMEDIILR